MNTQYYLNPLLARPIFFVRGNWARALRERKRIMRAEVVEKMK
jgi:hypothetical protein